MPAQKKLLTPKEASEFLGGAVSVRTLANLRSAGGGPVFMKLGHKTFYDEADLAKWLDDRKCSSTKDHKAS